MTATTAPKLEVRLLDDRHAGRWDAFVDAHPDGTFFHLSGWKRVIEESLGHRCYYFCVLEGDTLRGVVPLVHVNSRLFGNALISTAFCVYGGPLTLDQAARAALDEAAVTVARSLRTDHLEYRLDKPSGAGWACKDDLYVTFRRSLDPKPEANLTAVPRKQRAMIRKGIKQGLLSALDDDVSRFYPAYAESVRNLGTPVLPRRYFQGLKEQFGDACEVLTITHLGAPVSSVMNFHYRDQVLPYYGGGVAGARALAANDFMYWETMRRAISDRDAAVFDFGRSKVGTGSYAFKKHWGFEPEPLYYEYKLLRGQDVPDVNPLNPKYRAMIAIWKRLPLQMANTVGPMIARSLG